MKTITSATLIVFSIVLCTNHSWGFPDAVKIWDANGVPVTEAAGNQHRPVSTSDGAGGAIIVWEDWRDENRGGDIYGQRVGAEGGVLWAQDGVSFGSANKPDGQPASHRDPTIIADGYGGGILTWTDDRSMQGDVYAQRINASGDIHWQSQGIPICTACYQGGLCANGKHLPQIISDGTGGAIITWYEVRDGFHLSVWAQRVKHDGTVAWTLDGVPVAYGSFYADFPKTLSDGMGGAIIAWQDNRNANGFQIYTQRIDNNGVAQWATNGIKISPAIGERGSRGHSMVSDGAGGAIIVWVDRRNFEDANIFAQKIDLNGQTQWQTDGVPICTRSMEQYAPTCATDRSGGAIIAWEDQGASPPGSGQQWIYAQRISATGGLLWTVDGIPIYTNHGFSPNVVTDGVSGAYIVWNATIIVDPFFHIPSVFAQHVGGGGQTLWQSGGFQVYGEPYGHYGHESKAVSDGAGGVIIHWKDYRNTNTYWDIFAQRLTDSRRRAMPWLLLLQNNY